MPVLSPYATAGMLRALPEDGLRHELVWGEHLVSPAPSMAHQRIVAALYRTLHNHSSQRGLGEVLFSPADISWGEDTLVQPDVFVIAPEESGKRDWSSIRTLRLVVEVLSPSTARHDRFQKRRLYQAQGVETLWLIDPERRAVEVWTPGAAFPVVETERVTWRAGEAELVVPLSELFT